jgi:hypothetical protein
MNNCGIPACWLVDTQQRPLHAVGGIPWADTCTTLASGASARGKKGNL